MALVLSDMACCAQAQRLLSAHKLDEAMKLIDSCSNKQLITKMQAFKEMGLYANGTQAFLTRMPNTDQDEVLITLAAELQELELQSRTGKIDACYTVAEDHESGTGVLRANARDVADYVYPELLRMSGFLCLGSDVEAGTLLLCINSLAVNPMPMQLANRAEHRKLHNKDVRSRIEGSVKVRRDVQEICDHQACSFFTSFGRGYIVHSFPSDIQSTVDDSLDLDWDRLEDSVMALNDLQAYASWPLTMLLPRACNPNTTGTVIDMGNNKLVLLVRAAQDLHKGDQLLLGHPGISPFHDQTTRALRYSQADLSDCFCADCKWELTRRPRWNLAPVHVAALRKFEQQGASSIESSKASIIRPQLEAGIGGFIAQPWLFLKRCAYELGCDDFISKSCTGWFGPHHGPAFYSKLEEMYGDNPEDWELFE